MVPDRKLLGISCNVHVILVPLLPMCIEEITTYSYDPSTFVMKCLDFVREGDGFRRFSYHVYPKGDELGLHFDLYSYRR